MPPRFCPASFELDHCCRMTSREVPSDAPQPRSFVRRTGRVTAAQRRALALHWTHFGLPIDQQLDASAAFGRQAPLWLEIGFGMGDSLATLAQLHPRHDFIGIEVHEAGIGRLMALAAERDLSNLRIMRGDAVEILARCVAGGTLDGVLLYFPDPWPKKRHHKRRIVQPTFISQICTKLAIGGRFQIATDWEDYAQHMLTLLNAEPRLINLAGAGQFSPRPLERPETKFERRGLRLGHLVRDLVFERRQGLSHDQQGQSL